MKWDESWALRDGGKGKAGGQGSVRQVTRKSDQLLGGLKELHEQHLNRTERRFRMQQEVNALRALHGKRGIPILYDANTEEWEVKGIPLFAVMEWIEGPTLASYVGGVPRKLDEALATIESLSSTFESCHIVDIFHRDIKPDNVILRNGNPAEPVVVDFGMAWTKTEDEERGFETSTGQELGNRFLRLPEFAPGRQGPALRHLNASGFAFLHDRGPIATCSHKRKWQETS